MPKLGSYDSIQQISTSNIGICLKAQNRNTGEFADLRILSLPDNVELRNRVERRIRHASLIQHPVALRIVDQNLSHAPPFVCLEWVDKFPLREAIQSLSDPLPFAQCATQQLSALMNEINRMGLFDLQLDPRVLVTDQNGQVRFDILEALLILSLNELNAPQDQDDRSIPIENEFEAVSLLSQFLTGASRTKFQESPIPPAPVQPTSTDTVKAHSDLHDANQQVTGEFIAPGTAEMKIAPKCEHIGRFRLGAFIGEGGMSHVYRATDPIDDSTVAIKILKPHLATKGESVKRFLREARVLSTIHNPYVTELYEVNRDDERYFIAMELVSGKSLADWLQTKKRFSSSHAVAITSQVARGLSDAHQKCIIHRDIKPANIMLSQDPDLLPPDVTDWPSCVVKLTDFGLARSLSTNQSMDVTQAGSILGTPYYMAPEQCMGSVLTTATDVYALGITLYELIVGQPPFRAEDPLAVFAKHCSEQPPDIKIDDDPLIGLINPVLRKMLDKSPDVRQLTAAELTADLDVILREGASRGPHPQLPASSKHTVHMKFQWETVSSPDQLWPYVTDTDRLNQAIGLPAVDFEIEHNESGQMKKNAKARFSGIAMSWEEHPFEWIEGRRFGVCREFTKGVFKWFVSLVELAEQPGGTTLLSHSLWIEPRGLLGTVAANVEGRLKAQRSLGRVYRRIDLAISGKLGVAVDAFTTDAAESKSIRTDIDPILDRLATRDVDLAMLDWIGKYVARAPELELARIRPLMMARRFGLDQQKLVDLLLHAAAEKLFDLKWDLICPICRVSSDLRDALSELKEHGHCPACNLNYQLDQANGIELVFQVHPSIRHSDLRPYCGGGPAKSPHVVAQIRLQPGESHSMSMRLTSGEYLLRSPQVDRVSRFSVYPWGGAGSADVDVCNPSESLSTMTVGRQRITLYNSEDCEIVARIERTASDEAAYTAADAASNNTFRTLFPQEVLAPDQLIAVDEMVLLAAELQDSDVLFSQYGDQQSFELLYSFQKTAGESVQQFSGAIVNRSGTQLMAAFRDSEAAVRAALSIPGQVLPLEKYSPTVRMSLHSGPMYLATLDGQLTYFGRNVRLTWELLEQLNRGQLGLTLPVLMNSDVTSLLHERQIMGSPDQLEATRSDPTMFHRFDLGHE